MTSDLFFGILDPRDNKLIESWAVSMFDDLMHPDGMMAFLQKMSVARKRPSVVQNRDVQWTLYRADEAQSSEREVIGQWNRSILDRPKGIEMIAHEINIASGRFTRTTVELARLLKRNKISRLKERLTSLAENGHELIVESQPFSTKGFPDRVIGLWAFSGNRGYLLFERIDGAETRRAVMEQPTTRAQDAVELYLALCVRAKVYPVGHAPDPRQE